MKRRTQSDRDRDPRGPERVPRRSGREGPGRVIRHFSSRWRGTAPLIRERNRRPPGSPPPYRTASTYIPLAIFIPFSLLTLGIYPYIWMLMRIDAFASIGRAPFDRDRAAAYCIAGIAAQLVIIAGVLVRIFASSWIVGLIGLSILVLVVLPLRVYWLFELRRRIREETSAWDSDGLMIRRTVPSIFMLFIFGSAYIQFHVNRLIGLGMPGFGEYDDVPEWEDTSIGKALADFLRGGEDRDEQ